MPPLDPAVAETRVAVRRALTSAGCDGGLILVALSGGADSLALAAAVAFESRRAGWRAGAVIIDHGLQSASDEVAADAARAARALNLDPVMVCPISVAPGTGDGPEAAARLSRYRAFELARHATGARWILTGHTLDDQAEQVLLALARGSGTRSIAGIPPERDGVLRPFLTVHRASTERACRAQGLKPWSDPHNVDESFRRVRVRSLILPLIEREIGPGISDALARSAALAREDADALDCLAEALMPQAILDVRGDSGENVNGDEAGEKQIEVSVAQLASQPAALRHRIIRRVASDYFDAHLTRDHTAAVSALVTAWRGQGPIDVPGCTVCRTGGLLLFSARVK